MREPRDGRDDAESDPTITDASRPRSRLRLATLALAYVCLAGCGENENRAPDDRRTPGMTPTPAATAVPAACPSRIALHVDGPAVDLDLGSTGIGYDVPLHAGIVLPLATACDVTDPSCGTCTLAAAPPLPGERPRRRCGDDSRVVCATDADCATGGCLDFFGPPFGVTTGGAASCTRNVIVTLGPGTWTPATGDLDLPMFQRWTFYASIDVGVPCPRCTGAALGAAGVCTGGIHDGESCLVDGTDPLFGNTSYDCPPAPIAELGSFDLRMPFTTGTSRLEPVETCTSPPFTGLPCYCPGQTIANFCEDWACADGPDGEATCSDGPLDGLCARERFRGCFNDADCPADGDRCAFAPRECPAAGDRAIGNTEPLTRVGGADPAAPLLVAAFCVPASTDASPNQGLGLPGPAAIRLPVRLETGD